MKKKVMLGMSGGVDSSVAALLLKNAGYDVTGVTLRLRPDRYMEQCVSGGCCSIDDIDDARRVAYKIGIEHLVFNFTDIFEETVIDYFVKEYEQGRTPNPCIACNRHVKFNAMMKRAIELGFDYVATGHYACIEQNEQGRWLLKKAPAAKDQSYVLYSLTQFQLEHTLLPLATYTKPQIRAIAQEAGLIVANKPDSQEICFVPDKDYAGFIERYTGKKAEPGQFVDENGTVLGTHKGIAHYTIGQRKGLGISFGEPMFVTKINAEQNQIVLGKAGSQYAKQLVAGDINWISIERLTEPLKATAKTRYQAPPSPAVLLPMENGLVQVMFDEPQRSITPGQAVVFYDGDTVIGGGTILNNNA